MKLASKFLLMLLVFSVGVIAGSKIKPISNEEIRQALGQHDMMLQSYGEAIELHDEALSVIVHKVIDLQKQIDQMNMHIGDDN